jgi:hypothetical protein
MTFSIKDDMMHTEPNENPNIRKGKFLWLQDSARNRYLETISRKITEGFYFSENVISRIVDEIAPTFGEVMEQD